MELSKSELNQALHAPAQMRDQGSELPRFDALPLARVLELEIAKAEANGLTHIRLNMNLKDTADLAAFLRRGAVMGA